MTGIQAIGPEPEEEQAATAAGTGWPGRGGNAPKHAPRTWQRDRTKGGWSRLGPEGDAYGPSLEVVTDEELAAFERAARVGNRDLLRGRKLGERLDALALGRRTGLTLSDWTHGPVFTHAVADATGTP